MVQNTVQSTQTVYMQLETTNQSFLDMHYLLRDKGIKNNQFFLVLYDTDLIGVDPRDPNLSYQMKIKVLKECCFNYWYFLREVVRIPVQGGTVQSGIRYKLHRGNLAMNFLFILNYNQFVELPRQHGKTTAALCRYLWVFNFGTSNSEIMFIHKDHGGSKGNLANLKTYRDALPSYLQMSSLTGADGKKIRVPNTVETLQHPSNSNKIKTLPSAKNKATANNLGRGCTMPLQYYDEFAFILHNKIIYNAATPAYKTASKNAKMNNSPYGILLTTTPGDLLTDEGNYAYDFRNSATPWSENYYDLNYQELEELRLSNTNSSFFHVKYTYQQLGSGEDYFREMVVDLQKDWQAIRREVLLEWARAASNCPFKQEDLDIIEQYCREPIRTMLFGRAKQYQFNVYEDIDLRYPPIIGVDVAGAMYMDSSAITVVDSKSTTVSATLNCNYIPSDDLAEVIYILVSQYMPNAVINVERNGGFGSSVLQRLIKTSIKNNIYYEIKDKVLEERTNGVTTIRNTQKVKVFGLDSTKDTRARLIEILYDRVAYHKDKFIAPILHHEMRSMEVKKNGKIEHSSNSHDDQVFSYLMAMYVWYDGKNLMENFNIMKNSIRTDEDLEEAFTPLEDMYGAVEVIDIETTEVDENENNVLKDQLEILDEINKTKLFDQFQAEQEKEDELSLSLLFASNPAAKASWIRQNNFDPDVNTLGGYNDNNGVSIPSEVFDDFNNFSDPEYNIYQGNLGSMMENMDIY